MATSTDPERRQGAGLGLFLEALEARLHQRTAEQVEAALLAHAQRLVPREREPFLAIFAEPEAEDFRPSGDNQEDFRADPLLVEIDAFVERLRAGAYVDGSGWDGEIYEERAFGDESWVEEMDDLFAAAGSAFLEGELELAREALGRLLGAFELSEQVEAFCGPETPERMLSTDLGEAKARYLRAVYETTAGRERPAALLAAIAELRWVGDEARLEALEDTRRARLPELDAFLPAWIAHLQAADDEAPQGFGPDHGLPRLLSEAAEWQGGADGLGELARSRGAGDPDVHRDWIDALVRAGRHRDAAAAASEALTRLEPRGEARAAIAERLARLAAREGDDDGALDARRERWRSEPSTLRLLALLDIAAALGRAEGMLAAEARWALAEGAESGARNVANERLLCELLLLAGCVEQAVEVLQGASALGWSHRDHPGPIVVPYLLVAATGPTIRPELLIAAGDPFEGAERDEPLLAQELEHIDRDGWVAGPSSPPWDADDEPAEPALDDRYRAIAPEKLLPSFLLADALAERPTSGEQRERWLTIAARIVEERVAAIVTAKHRGAYERAARLAVACGEAIGLARDRDGGARFVADARERFPRHSAFRAELDRATTQSPLLPAPPAKKRR